MQNKSTYFLQEFLMLRVIGILGREEDLNASLQQVCDALAGAATSPHSVYARISLNGRSFESQPFKESGIEAKSTFSFFSGF